MSGRGFPSVGAGTVTVVQSAIVLVGVAAHGAVTAMKSSAAAATISAPELTTQQTLPDIIRDTAAVLLIGTMNIGVRIGVALPDWVPVAVVQSALSVMLYAGVLILLAVCIAKQASLVSEFNHG